MRTRFLKRLGAIFLLAGMVSLAGYAENQKRSENKLAPLYYDCMGMRCLKPEQIICKLDEEGKYLKLHRKYKFTYDDKNRIIRKEAYKWSKQNEQWTPDYLQTFNYQENQIETEYSVWDKRSKSYAPPKEKAIYKTCHLGVMAYTSYKRDVSDNEWKLTIDLPEIYPNRLIVEK